MNGDEPQIEEEASGLVQGGLYFAVVFHDHECQIPVIQTLIYERRSKDSNGESVYLFKYIPVNDEESLFFVRVDDADQVLYTKERLIDRLSTLGHEH